MAKKSGKKRTPAAAPVLSLAELRALAATNTRPMFKEVDVPQWPGSRVRLRRLTAVGLAEVVDLWTELPKDAEGKALATAESLVDFYELLLADTVVDASNLPLFANAEDRQILHDNPAVLMFLGNEARDFNSDILSVEKEKKSKAPPGASPSSSAGS